MTTPYYQDDWVTLWRDLGDLTKLRRLLSAATPGPWVVDDEGDDVAVIVDDGDEFTFIQIAADLHQGDNGLTDARLIAAAVNALPALLDAAEESDALRAERDALAAMLSGRCLSDITHRDEEHRQSVCMLPEGHAPLAHDDCMGCTWTDAEHWEPSAIDALAEECDGWRHLADVRSAAVERVRALHRPEGRHSFCGTCAYAPWPCATYRALDGKADKVGKKAAGRELDGRTWDEYPDAARRLRAALDEEQR